EFVGEEVFTLLFHLGANESDGGQGDDREGGNDVLAFHMDTPRRNSTLLHRSVDFITGRRQDLRNRPNNQFGSYRAKTARRASGGRSVVARMAWISQLCCPS